MNILMIAITKILPIVEISLLCIPFHIAALRLLLILLEFNPSLSILSAFDSKLQNV
jgi:hypothetical protein